MADLAVKEVDVLKAYTSKMNDFKNGCTAVGALIDVQIRRIKDDLSKKANEAHNMQNYAQQKVDSVVSRYENARSYCANADPYIGQSDTQCKMKMQEVDMLSEQINCQLQQLVMELENAGQHTKNFCLQTINMVEGCQSHMNKTIDNIERYREQN